MIHDILLSCLNVNSDASPLEEFLVSDGVSKYFHPCERNILKDILEILKLLRKVAKFAQTYGTRISSNPTASDFETDEPLQNGLYLNAFANGVSKVLDEYINDITELERKYLMNPKQSLMFVFHKIQEYEPLASYLTVLIRGVCSQRLHGCAILQYLQQYSLHGDARVAKAIKVIQTSVNVIFLKQLTNWILYAKIIDTCGEFFIQSAAECSGNSSGLEKGTSGGGGKAAVTSYSDTSSNYADIWHYEVCYEFLPRHFSSTWAEKVLFIGQTVLIFKVDTEKQEKSAQTWNKFEENLNAYQTESFWKEEEHIYYAKIQNLLNDDGLIVSHYEGLIDEIKMHVTSRLSEIAVNQADLVNQLRLLKDFFLLGRGELFLEFIRQMYDINKDAENTNKIRDFVKAFESAAHAVGISEEMEQFSLCMAKPPADYEESFEFGYLHCIQLQYKINWPLHLIFSPKVLDRYNNLFRFLLHVKKLQYELHMVWNKSTIKKKSRFNQNIKVIQLRNELMFFVDNLQYYIQVDVLDSQFSILLNAIQNQADFEQIQKTHSVFLANILSLCFILPEDDVDKTIYNPVNLIINEVFHICNDFCRFIDDESSELSAVYEHIDYLDKRFGKLVQQLINLLVGLKTATSTAPLSQLILRLDYNHWFSSRKSKIN